MTDRQRLERPGHARPATSRPRCASLLASSPRARTPAYVPARVLNLVVRRRPRVAAARSPTGCARVGRYHPSRTIVCAVEPRPHDARRGRDDRGAVGDPATGELGAAARDGRASTCGERHLAHLDPIVDPLVVTDLADVRVVAARPPRGGRRAAATSRRSCCSTRVDEPDAARRGPPRARSSPSEAYVVDLAWLRSTPWRERIAATFDPPQLRPELRTISAVTVRHHPESAVAGAAAARLAGRRGWAGSPSPLVARQRARCTARPHARRQDVRAAAGARPRRMSVRGLAGLDARDRVGARAARWTAGPGGLRARYRDTQAAPSASGRSSAPRAARRASSARASARRCCATRPTGPALEARRGAAAVKQVACGDVPLGGSPFPPIAEYAFLSDCEVTALVAPSGDDRVDVPAADGRRRRSSARCSTATPAASGSARPTRPSPPAAATCPGTMVLETTWGTRTGWVIVRDVLLVGPWHHEDERSHTHRRAPDRLRRRPRPAAHAALRQRLGRDGPRLRRRCSTTGARRCAWEYVEDGYHKARAHAPTATTLRAHARHRPAPGLRGRQRPRAHHDARRRRRLRRAVVERARRAGELRRAPTSGSSAPPTTGTSGCRAASSPTTRGASTCSAAR